ncbi:hypothetical protein Tco_0716898 [Tanacetum coccineum]
MGGSSSQPQPSQPPRSPINAFPLEELYTPDFSDNTGYWQEPIPYEATIAWTTEEEIVLAKVWKSVFKNSERGNARKKDRFWVEVMGPKRRHRQL